MVSDDPTLPPRHLVENYRRAYETLNKREPVIRYMGNHWYFVNGETVHRVTLIEEIARLRTLTQRQSLLQGDKGLIHRLIDRLRNL
jgi:hypothetical protein